MIRAQNRSIISYFRSIFRYLSQLFFEKIICTIGRKSIKPTTSIVMKRSTLNKIYRHRYRHVGCDYAGAFNCCTYCGDIGATKDHIPAIESAHLFSPQVYDYIIVPACWSCNTILNAQALPTIVARANYILGELYINLMHAKRINHIVTAKLLKLRIKYLEDTYGTMV